MAEYALGAFLARWYPSTRHDLAASESETWQVRELLAMASAEDRARWDELDLRYTDPRGAAWLRERIATRYDSKASDEIVCFAGAQEALGLTLRALAGPDDHAIMILPTYQPSEIALTSLCATTGVALDANRAWELDLDRVALAIRPNTKLILINFPNNPTGKLISAARFAELISLCRKHGLWLVNDEVYREIDRDPARRLPPVANAYERGVSIDALSKGYGLPGLRVGWMACQDKALLRKATELKQIASLCLAAPSEVLAHVALGVADTLLGRNRRIADSNLAVLHSFLAEHPHLFDWHEPEGGVVGYVRYRGQDGVEAFTTRMARDAGVLVLPSSVWCSSLCPLPTDRFRIGFGRQGTAAGIAEMNRALRNHGLSAA
jgi:aspartate/methionine/tyrosine aminotransferase